MRKFYGRSFLLKLTRAFVFCTFTVCLLGRLPMSFAADSDLTPLTEIENYSEDWEYVSFLEDAGLQGRSIYYFDFDRNNNVWVAAADGLYYYNGYLWTRYSTDDGLPSNMVRCVCVLRDGTVWVGTDSGAGTFDGKTFATHGSKEGLAGPSVRRIVEDADGSLWFCCDRYPDFNVPSGLSCYKNDRWTIYNDENGFPSKHPADVFRDSQGEQYVLTGDRGLLKKSGADWIFPLSEFGLARNETLWSIAEFDSLHIVTSYEGAYFFQNGRWRFENAFPRKTAYQLCKTRDGRLFSIGPVSERENTYDMGLVEWNGERFEPILSTLYPEDQWVEFVREAPDGSIWCGGKDFLIRWTKGNREWKIFKDFPPPRFVDGLGDVWFIGGDLLIRSTPDGWTPWTSVKGNKYRQDVEGDIWLFDSTTLSRWTKDENRVYDCRSIRMRDSTSFFVDRSQRVWVQGYSDDGTLRLYSFSNETWKGVDDPELTNRRISCISSDLHGGVWLVVLAERESYYRLLQFSETEKKRSIDIDVAFSAPPNLHVDRNGRLWLFDAMNLYSRDLSNENEWKPEKNTVGGVLFQIYDAFNALWFVCDAGTFGQSGITRFSNGRWTHFRDRIYNYSKMYDETILCVGRKGAYVFKSADEEPNRITTPKTGFTAGAVYEDSGVFWIKYGSDVYRYQSDGVPPETLLETTQNDVYQGDLFSIDCDAVEYFLPHSVKKYYRYSWRIDEETWRPFSSSTQITIDSSSLSIGDHTIDVRAIDEGLDVDPTPARVTFAVLPTPLQNRWWFRTVVASVGSIVVFLTLVSVALALIAMKSRNLAREERRALQWISQKLAGPLTAREIALSAANESKRIFQHDVFSLEMYDAENEEFHTVYREETPPNRTASSGSISPNETLSNPDEAYDRILLGETLLLESSQQNDGGADATGDASSPNSRSMMFAPIVWRDRTIGMISVQSNSMGRYKNHHLDLLKSFADHCSGALARIRMEDELEKSQSQLMQSQKLEAVGRLAGGVAHDFNNLLVAILGYSDIALMEMGPESPYRRRIEEIVKAGNRAKSLTQQLLAFSRKQIVQPVILDLNAVLSDMFGMLQRLLGEDIEIDSELEPSLGSVECDRGQLEQVIVNLSVNARDAMPQGGRLVVRTKNVDLQTSAESQKVGVVPGAYVLLSVRDDGCGMDGETIEKIFEPFFSTKEKGKGTGLGLSTVYGIIRQNGGAVEVTSSLGKGSSFNVYLPRVESEPSRGGPVERAAPLSLYGNETILLTEDQTQVRDLVSGVLQNYGYTVLEARNGLEAMDLQAKHKNPIHLLVTDVVMPGMSGVELSVSIASQRPEIQTVFISGYTDDVLDVHGVLEPGKTLVFKPFSNEELLTAVRRVLDENR